MSEAALRSNSTRTDISPLSDAVRRFGVETPQAEGDSATSVDPSPFQCNIVCFKSRIPGLNHGAISLVLGMQQSPECL